jgi:hypothetical protein
MIGRSPTKERILYTLLAICVGLFIWGITMSSTKP